MNDHEGNAESVRASVAACHRILRLTTIFILGAFVLIIASTTISTGPFVQYLAKGLYWIIVINAALSLLVWLYRTRLERRLAPDSVDHKRTSSM